MRFHSSSWGSRGRHLLRSTAALLLAASPPLLAESQPSLHDTIDVQVVNVEAVVTGSHGIRITGLRPDDFRLFVDDRETPIEFFTEVIGGRAVSGPAASASGDVGVSYLVFIDEYFTVAADRDRVVRRLAAELDRMRPQDRMAVVAWDGSHLDMLSSWSQSPRDLATALRVAEGRPAHGLERLAELRNFEFGRSNLFGRGVRAVSLDHQHLDIEERSYLDRLERQLDRAVGAVTATLRGFAEPPGRKVLLLLSGGWPSSPMEYVVGAPERQVLDRRGREGLGLYGPMVDTANLLGFTIYPVDLPGLEGRSSFAAARPGALHPVNRELWREREVEHGLRLMAAETGGLALLNSGRDHILERVAEDTSSYYWIGFTPDRLGDDVRRRVRLVVVDPGLDLRSRRGFLDSSKSAEVSMAVESALLFGGGGLEDGLGVRVGEGRRAGIGKVTVPIEVSLPFDQVTLFREGDEWVGQLELRVAVMDAAGNRADIAVLPIEVREDRLPGPDRSFQYETTLRMRSRDHDMMVSLYDPASGEIWASEAVYRR